MAKVSVHLGTRLEALARKRTQPDRGISATLAVCLERYFLFCDHSLPQLTAAEWGLLSEVFQNKRPDPELLWAPVSAATNHGELARKIQKMTLPERIALADFLELSKE